MESEKATVQKHTSRKAEAVKQAVVAKRLQGESKSQISRDLGIHRGTVDNILSESQVEAAVAQGRSELIQLVPAAIGLIRKALQDGSAADEVPKAALDAAIQVIKGCGVYEERSRTKGEVHIVDSYATADTEQLRTELADRLGALGSRKPN